MPDLLLWDVDHTLISNGGVSKMNYRLAYEILVGCPPSVGPQTDGRTDSSIVANLLTANGIDVRWSPAEQFAALAEAGHRNRHLMAERGHALPGANDVLLLLHADRGVISSVLTGNIIDNARVKLGSFGLDRWLDWDCGAFGSESAVRSDLVAVAQRKAAELRDFDPARDATVLIGDTHRDVEAGVDGGARVVGVATGGETVDELMAAGADVAIPSLADVQAALDAIAFARSLGPVFVGS